MSHIQRHRRGKAAVDSQALRKHEDGDWNLQVLQCIERRQRQAAPTRQARLLLTAPCGSTRMEIGTSKCYNALNEDSDETQTHRRRAANAEWMSRSESLWPKVRHGMACFPSRNAMKHGVDLATVSQRHSISTTFGKCTSINGYAPSQRPSDGTRCLANAMST